MGEPFKPEQENPDLFGAVPNMSINSTELNPPIATGNISNSDNTQNQGYDQNYSQNYDKPAGQTEIPQPQQNAEVTVKLEQDEEPKKQKRRKKKVEMACVYCRRSHMICDDQRPCLRCVKRGIGHLCHDEPTPGRKKRTPESGEPGPVAPGPVPVAPGPAGQIVGAGGAPTAGVLAPVAQKSALANPGSAPANPGTFPMPFDGPVAPPAANNANSNGLALAKTLPFQEEPFFYSEHAGLEFSLLNDFLAMIDDPDLHGLQQNNQNDLMSMQMPDQLSLLPVMPYNQVPQTQNGQNGQNTQNSQNSQNNQNGQQSPVQPARLSLSQEKPVISDLARDKFFLTAADPTIEISPEERLKQVIKAKLEAGLLQPYNYAKGYARLQSYMDNYMNQLSRQRILKPLSIFRPAFRAIAKTLKDVDLVLVEESFERMLLDYDRVFTSMAIPACLWRRTGEIYRGNKEFALLVGVTTDDLKDGKLAIYELMSEELAVNFWEKYGAIAFDKGQKAVLTSCNLRTKDGYKRKSCCFSFTIRRDRYNIPSCIVGNFIPIDP